MDEFENEARSWIQEYASEKPKVPIYKQPKPIQQIYETWSSETWSRRGPVLISKQPVVIRELYKTSWRLGCILMYATGQPGCRLSLIPQHIVLITFDMSICHNMTHTFSRWSDNHVANWLCHTARSLSRVAPQKHLRFELTLSDHLPQPPLVPQHQPQLQPRIQSQVHHVPKVSSCHVDIGDSVWCGLRKLMAETLAELENLLVLDGDLVGDVCF